MKASRAAIQTAKAVKAVEERLGAVESRLAAIEEQFAKFEHVLQQLLVTVTAEKPTTAAEVPGKPGARTSRKKGGGA